MFYLLLSDIAVNIGSFCASLAEHHSARRDVWLERGKLWADIRTWFLHRGTKKFSEIRDRRKTVK
ncbi:hypothetical protein CWO89_01995 [Bradyrhizobium sp. Leo170]|nr:hypothetical protein CWO89_01995 [Bradyrhizobium sp. Leo170]